MMLLMSRQTLEAAVVEALMEKYRIAHRRFYKLMRWLGYALQLTIDPIVVDGQEIPGFHIATFKFVVPKRHSLKDSLIKEG